MQTWPRSENVAAVDAATVEYLGRHWEDGWNRQDTALIVEPFAAEVVFSSPFISRLEGDASVTTIEGFDAVRAYVAASFERATPDIGYTLGASYAGTDGVVLVYTVHHPTRGDLPGADLMTLDASGKVAEWRCHYPFEE